MVGAKGLLISIILCLCWYVATQAYLEFGPGASSASSRQAAASDLVTLAQYQQLTDDMSYSEVVRIIGRSGEELASGGTTKAYVWRNEGGANITAWFLNDKLTAKAQFGLR
jgi:hypothetical protein